MASDTNDGSNGGNGGNGGGHGSGMAVTAAAGTTSLDLYYLVMCAWLSVNGGLGRDHAGGGSGEGGRHLQTALSLLDLMEC